MSSAVFPKKPLLFDPGQIRQQPNAIDRLLMVMQALRDPDHGCPWDLEQTYETIAPYTIEEAYEVADAIHTGSRADLKEELGDLLLQVVYHSQIAQEEQAFDFEDVSAAIAEKMIRRHPHVFGDAAQRSTEMQKGAWEQQKAEERQAKAKSQGCPQSVLDDIAQNIPALMYAEKLQKRAARVGFDWDDAEGVFKKLDEEIAEVQNASSDAERAEEIGDLLFTLANLARKFAVDPEESLRMANRKFERRFRALETNINYNFNQYNINELENEWQQVKSTEKG